eukprot:PhM_4_TR18000/c0_g1_i1/m.89120/K18106/GAAA; D-galacturonate reductase
MHKRHDPVYSDAVQRARSNELGPFLYFSSYMSQPKRQLKTFAKWAGSGSDISYYLNSHHIDILCWMVEEYSSPLRVTGTSAHGVAIGMGFTTEDLITLSVQWQNDNGDGATSTHTAAWAAPKSDVHSQQRFHYMGQQGEVNADQAHRGYTVATDTNGLISCNPLYMKYTPSPSGHFDGQRGYGYTIMEAFIKSVQLKRAGVADTCAHRLVQASSRAAFLVTAILDAGRQSLDNAGRPMEIEFGTDGLPSDIRAGWLEDYPAGSPMAVGSPGRTRITLPEMK